MPPHRPAEALSSPRSHDSHRPARRSVTGALALAAFVAVAQPALLAHAETPDFGALLQGSPAQEGVTGGVFGDIGFGQVGEDFFVGIAPGFTLQFWRIGLGLQVPLRFRVIDYDPQNDSVLRSEDWDEVSDFTKIIRFIEYGRPHDPLYIRVGELTGATLGHGTIVDQYYNTVDIDHYQTGLQVHVDAGVAGGQTLLDNLFDPNIFALRGFVRPLAFFALPELVQRLTVGLTYASDYQAPSGFRLDADGKRQVHDTGEFVVSTDVVTLYGLDIGWEVLRYDWVSLTPYIDLNFIDAMGLGFHAGVLTTFTLPADTTLFARFEYRYLTSKFAAGYINSLYEIERYRFRADTPKLRYLRDLPGGDGQHGFFGEAALSLFARVTLTLTYEDYEGANNSNLMIRLRLPWLGPVQFQAFYAKRNFEGAGEVFTLDGALLLAELRVRLLSFLYVFGQYSRQWHVVGDDVTGHRYATVNDWNVGVGAAFEF